MKGRESLILNDKINCDDPYWLQGLEYNLLSVAQLSNTSHGLEFLNAKIIIYDVDEKFIRTGEQRRGNLLYLDPTISAFLFAKFEDVCLWHKRIFHVKFDNMIKSSIKNKV